MDYFSYAVKLRRELHQIPEIGFDLPKTLAVVRRELENMGVAYTEEFCKSSIVGTINPEKTGFTIGLRADMDALPLQEQSSCPFPSKHEGKMHACGHDMHTATLLAVARQLVDRKDEIHCRVKLLFTPAEEYVEPGCAVMAEAGVMEDIDCAIAFHVVPTEKVGMVSVEKGGQCANSMGIRIQFFGQASHAARQHRGKDAITMACQAALAMQTMIAHEIDPSEPRLLNIGSIHGGITNNIICDQCELFCSSRTHSDAVSDYIFKRCQEICEGVAQMNGGRAEVTMTRLLPYVVNDPILWERMREAAIKVVGEEHLWKRKRSLGGEDFAFFSRKKPCFQFHVGTQNDDPDSALPLHNNKVIFDERAMQVAMDVFVQFVLDNSNGISLEDVRI